MKGFILATILTQLESEFEQKLTATLKTGLPEGRLSDVYLSTEDYPDNSLDYMIADIAKILSMEKSTLAKIVGVYLFSDLMVINPAWIQQCNSSYEAIKTHDAALNNITKTNMPGFIPPSFVATEISRDVLQVTYRSTFLPWDVAEGLIVAISNYYHEHLHIERLIPEPPVDFNMTFFLRRKTGMPISAG